MRDVEALRSRVLIISHGKVIYDGGLSRIIEEFGQSKLVRLQFAGQNVPEGLDLFGEVAREEGPIAELKVDTPRVAEVLGAILDQYTVIDMSVQDPPLDQVIARLFEEAHARHEAV